MLYLKFAANPKRFPLLLLMVASCAPFGNYLLTGHWEDPNSTAATSATAEASSAPAVATAASASSASAVSERSVPELPSAHGPWHLHRTSRAFFGWTGAGEKFQLFAFELGTDSDCWYSKLGDRPEAQHCPSGDAPAGAVNGSIGGKEAENIFSGYSIVPWKVANADTPLREGSPRVEGEGEVTMTIPWSQGRRVFSLSSVSNVLLVDGAEPDWFDGCARANGSISVFNGISVRVGKNKCGIRRGRTPNTSSLSIDQYVISFTTREKGPNLAEAREQAARIRQKGKGQMLMDVSGDATHTLITFAGKRSDGEEKSAVEAISTIQGVNYRCESTIDRMDLAWVLTVKRICGSMAK